MPYSIVRMLLGVMRAAGVLHHRAAAHDTGHSGTNGGLRQAIKNARVRRALS
jgi:hypothetical protein